MSLIILHSHPSDSLFPFDFYSLNLFSYGVAHGLTASELRLAASQIQQAISV
jgi:hypothetical protein